MNEQVKGVGIAMDEEMLETIMVGLVIASKTLMHSGDHAKGRLEDDNLPLEEKEKDAKMLLEMMLMLEKMRKILKVLHEARDRVKADSDVEAPIPTAVVDDLEVH